MVELFSASNDNIVDESALLPDDIERIIDTTAEFVARYGYRFENRIIENNAGNPNFSFMNQSSHPYYPYYQHLLYEYRTQINQQHSDDESEAEALPPPPPPPSPSNHNSVNSVPPPPPASSSLLDIPRIVDITAKLVSRYGSEFENRIAVNNAGNPKFNFLNQSSHPYHAYYQHRLSQFRRSPSP